MKGFWICRRNGRFTSWYSKHNGLLNTLRNILNLFFRFWKDIFLQILENILRAIFVLKNPRNNDLLCCCNGLAILYNMVCNCGYNSSYGYMFQKNSIWPGIWLSGTFRICRLKFSTRNFRFFVLKVPLLDNRYIILQVSNQYSFYWKTKNLIEMLDGFFFIWLKITTSFTYILTNLNSFNNPSIYFCIYARLFLNPIIATFYCSLPQWLTTVSLCRSKNLTGHW